MENQKHLQPEPYKDSAEVRARKWIEAYLDRYLDSMQSFREQLRSEALSEQDGAKHLSRDGLYDPKLRLLEEMPLCALWFRWSLINPLPLGFGLVQGSIVIEDAFLDFPTQTSRADHQYLEAMDGTGVIIDHCPAQFYWRRSEDIGRGSRLETVTALSEGLVRSFTTNSGISHRFLIGNRNDIAERLGLRYDTAPRYES